MSLQVEKSVEALRARLARHRSTSRRIGFVPTMGALHEGHASLVRAARMDVEVVVASIFVNPLQFGPAEDLGRYPRRPAEDRAFLEELGCDVLYVPDVEEMYPTGFSTRVEMEGLTDVLCGARRPGHFSGVLTVVLKLLNQVAPHVVYLGRKDYQQALVVRRMVRDLDLPVTVETCPTVREADGLALSSRNAYLSGGERQQAAALRRAVLAMDAAFRAGEREAARLLAAGRDLLAANPLVRLDYLEIRDAETLAERTEEAREGDLVAVAAWLGSTRLIDNDRLGCA